MSYSIYMVDKNTGKDLCLKTARFMVNAVMPAHIDPVTGKFVEDPQTDASATITYNYAKYFYEAGEGDDRFLKEWRGSIKNVGIRAIYGLSGAESLPMLSDMVKRIEARYKVNGEWKTAERTRPRYYDKKGKEYTNPISCIIRDIDVKEVREPYTVSEGDTSDYWEITAANAITALKNLMHIAVELPDGIWKGD